MPPGEPYLHEISGQLCGDVSLQEEKGKVIRRAQPLPPPLERQRDAESCLISRNGSCTGNKAL